MYWKHWKVLEVLECVVMPGRLECPCRTGMPMEGLAAGMPGMPCRSL